MAVFVHKLFTHSCLDNFFVGAIIKVALVAHMFKIVKSFLRDLF